MNRHRNCLSFVGWLKRSKQEGLIVSQGFEVRAIVGFVEELFVRDDPEFQWIDKIRTPRASNEARQAVFVKLAAELQRKIGLKVLDMGGNAVLSYRQHFDLEGDAMVARGIGTAVTVVSTLAAGRPKNWQKSLPWIIASPVS